MRFWLCPWRARASLRSSCSKASTRSRRGLAAPSSPEAGAADAGEDGAARPLRERVDAFERALLSEALARQGHNQKRTAAVLGLSYDQLRGLLRRHDLRTRRRRRDTAPSP